MKRIMLKALSIILATAIVLCSAPLLGIVGLGSIFVPKASAVEGESKIKSYAELDAAYDNFIYLGSEVYEIETADGTLSTAVIGGELTDYYVQPGQLLEERLYVKGDFYFGNSTFIKAYDNLFFDVTQITTDAVDTTGYSTNRPGVVNSENPAVIKNGLTNTVTSADCATENWMIDRSGYTADELAVIDYVQSTIKYSSSSSRTAYVFDNDVWLVSWVYKVKDNLEYGATGYSKTLPGFWNCDDTTAETKNSAWASRRGSISIASRFPGATEEDDNNVLVNSTKTSYINYDLIDTFLFEDLEHYFVVGDKPGENVMGVSNVKSYAELAAQYDNFIYLASEVYEIETADGTLSTAVTGATLTDYYVDAGQLLEERFYIKGDFYFGNSQFVKAYDNSFFDVTQITTADVDSLGYSTAYDGVVNPENPVVIKNDLENMVTSGDCATEGWMKNRSGYTADELAKIDYVQSVISYSGYKSDKAYVFDDDVWLVSWVYKVKDGLADGTTGYSKTLPGFWNCETATADEKQTGWMQRKGTINIGIKPADSTPEEDDLVYVTDTKTSYVNYDLIENFLFGDLEHNFIVGKNYTNMPYLPNKGESKVKSYSELAAQYDNFIYLGSEVYEIETTDGTLSGNVTDRVLTDYYVTSGQLLEERLYIKGDFYFGNSIFVKAYDNSFFDVTQITTSAPDTTGYSTAYDGIVNPENPVVIKNDLENTVTSADCATEGWMKNRSGYTADELAVIDYVQSVISYSGNKSDKAYIFDDDVWLVSWVYRVKDGLADGTTGYSKTLSGFWNCDDATAESKTNYWMQRKGTINIGTKPANSTPAEDDLVYVTDTKTSYVNYDLIEHFLFNDLEHHFVIGNQPQLQFNVTFLENDGTTISSNTYIKNTRIIAPAAVEGQIGWADTATGEFVDLTNYTVRRKAEFKRVLVTDEFDIVINVNGGTVNEENLPENAELDENGRIILKADYSNKQINLNDALPIPEKEGYTGAWSPEIITVDNINDKSAEVVWTANTYKATFYANKGDAEPLAVVDVTFGTSVSRAVTAPEGYKFAGWADAETDEVVSTLHRFKYNYASDKSFYALWAQYDSSVTFMVRDYENGSGWKVGAVTYGDAGMKLTSSNITSILSNIETENGVMVSPALRPVYSDSALKNHFDTSSGITYNGNIVLYVGSTLSFNVTWNIPVCENLVPTGEYTTVTTTPATAISGTENVYSVKASSGMDIPVGFRIAGWINEATGEVLECDEDAAVTLVKNMGTDIVLVAQLELTRHSITWNADDWEKVDEYNYGDTIVAPEIPEREGFTFVGWTPAVPETITYDMYFIAVYELSGGSCGENATFIFDKSTGKLVISGEGEITSAPWSSDDACGLIREVEISEGITAISDNAFAGCINLTNVTLPKSLGAIGASAFANCPELAEVNYLDNDKAWNMIVIGEGNECLTGANIHYTYSNEDKFTYIIENGEAIVTGYNMDIITNGVIEIPTILEGCPVTAIGENAFYSCNEIVSVSVPEGVKTIGDYAFAWSSNLASISFPDSLENIGISSVYDTAYYYDDSNWEDGGLYVSNHLIEAKYELSGTYSIKEGTLTVATDAFNSRNDITSLSIPESLAYISDGAFGYMMGLESFIVDENNAAFASVDGVLFNKDKTVLISYPANRAGEHYIIPDGVTEINEYAFWFSKFTSVTLPESLTDIGGSAFMDCFNLKDITVPDSVISVGEAAFSYCDALECVTFGSGVESIGIGAFIHSSSIRNINVSEDNLYYTSFDGVMFNKEKTTLVTYPCAKPDTLYTVPLGVTDISDGAFFTSENLTSVVILDGVTSIGNSAFNSCSNLTSVEIPDSVTRMGVACFGYCDSLTAVAIPEGVTVIERETFSQCDSLTAIEIPEGVTVIGPRAFGNCTGITMIFYGGTEEQWNEIQIDEYNEPLGSAKIFYSSSFDSRFTYTIENGEATVTGYNMDIITDGVIAIPATLEGCPVTAIGEKAFYAHDEIVSVLIPSSVKKIGASAFSQCTSLATVNIAEGVEIIDKSAFYNCTSITEIVVPEGVTSIGVSAFANCTSLAVINLSSTVEAIGNNAFNGSNALEAINVAEDNAVFSSDENGVLYNKDKTEIKIYPIGKTAETFVIPDGVTSIAASAFKGSRYLNFVTVPEGITSIATTAFAACTALATIELPVTLVTVANGAFNGCSALADVYYGGTLSQWQAISIGTSNASLTAATLHYQTDPEKALIYEIVDGCAVITGYNSSEFQNEKLLIPATLGGYPVTEIGESAFDSLPMIEKLVLPDSLVTIGAKAFYNCDVLTDITLGNGVKAIGDFAFYDCDSIKVITLPDSVRTIGTNAFEHCSALNAVDFGNGVESIGDAAFHTCTQLVEITIPDSVTSIGQDAFYDCDSVATFTFGGGIETIGSTYGLSSCGSLKTVVISEGVKAIGDSAFYDFDNITAVTIADSVKTIGDYAFHDCDYLTTVNMGNGVETIGDYAFYWCYNLNTITIPDSVKTIGVYAFYYCTSLYSITIGNGVETIGYDAFGNCHNLATVTMGNSVKTIGSNAFYYCRNLQSIELPDSLESIGDYAFAWCDNLASVTIGSGVSSIGEGAFYECNKLSSISVSADNRHFAEIDGVLYNKDITLLVCYPGGKTETEFVLPDSVEKVKEVALRSDYLINIYLGAALNNIDGIEILYTPYLVNVFASDENACFADEDGILFSKDMTKLLLYPCAREATEYVVPDGVVTVGGNAFYNCYYLVSVTIPDSVTVLESYAFHGCSCLETVTIGNGVESLGGYTFYSCYNLKNVFIGSGVKEIDANAFEDCPYLSNMTISEDNQNFSADDGVLFNKDKTVLIRYPQSKTETEYVIPDGVIAIADSAFYYCYRLESIEMPDSLVTIGENAFAACNGIEEIVIPDSVTTVGDYAFESCSNLKSVTIGDGIESLGQDVFASCYYIEDITIGSGIKEFNYEMLGYGCRPENIFVSQDNPYFSGIDGVLFSKDKTELVVYPAGRGETEYVIPDGVKVIGDYAFEYNRWLTTVVFPDGLTTIGNEAFYGCVYLTDIDFPDSVTTIGNHAFFECESLTDIVLPDSLTFLGIQAFAYCPDVKNVDIGSKMKDLSMQAFKYGCYVENFTVSEDNPYLTADDGIVFNKDKTKLIFCPPRKSIEEYAVPDGVQIIGSSAFEGSRITKVTLPDSLVQIQSGAFVDCEYIEEIIIPNGVTYIGDVAFASCSSITSLVIPDSVKYLGVAFADYCQKLESVSIGSGVEEIFSEFSMETGFGSFTNCDSLKNIDVSADNQYYSSENGVLFNKDKTKLVRYPAGKTDAGYVVPGSVKSIELGAFLECQSLAEVTLPEGLVSIGHLAFNECENLDITEIPDSVKYIGVDVFGYTKTEENPSNYVNGDFVIDGCLIEAESSDSGSYNIGSDIRFVAEGAFTYGEYSEITVDPANTSCEVIDGVLFTEDGKILHTYPYSKDDESYTVPDGVEYIAAFAFADNYHIKNVTLPDSVENIGYYSFAECENLEGIDLGNGLKNIGDAAFGMCVNLSTVEIPDSVEKIGGLAFYACYNLSEAVIGNGVESIGWGAFGECVNLSYVYIPNSVFRIAENAFAMCDSLESVYYDGSEDEWNNIYIDGYNEPLLNADIIFDLVTVTWDVDGEKTVAEYEKGDEILLPETPVKVGYDFAGWTPEVPATMPGKSLEFAATWELRSHTVTWVCDDTEITATHKYGEEIAVPDPPEKEGHTFAGWGAEIPATMPDSDLVFTAQWTVNTYNITWDSDGNETVEQYDYGSVIDPPVPEKEGHTFIEWSPEIPVTMPAEDLVFTAVYEVNTYTVEWLIDGLSMNESYKYGEAIEKPKAFNKKGYTFAGWTPEIPETMPAHNIVFTATWTANFYDAVFSANGGTFPDGDSIKKISTEYITAIAVPETPVRPGYEFAGWAFEGKNIGTNVGIMDCIEGKNYEAIWVSNETTKYRIETYTMNTVGEYEKTSITLNGNLYDTITLSPEADNGFVLNEEKSVLSGTLTANNTLVLKVYFDRCKYSFKVFVSGTETVTHYYYGSMIAEPAAPEKEGYEFVGWSSEIPATMPAEDVSISAKFQKVQYVDTTPRIVIATPEMRTLNYGESLTLRAVVSNLPNGATIKWSVEGDGVSIQPSLNGKTCKVTSTSNGNVVIKAYIVDARGNTIAGSDGKPLADTEYLYSEVTFWQIIISFVKRLFGITNNMIF